MNWIYDLCLGYNMWYDKEATRVFSQHDNHERDFLLFDRSAWDKTVNFLPSCGVTHLVVELAEGVQYDCLPGARVKGSLPKEEIKEMLAHVRELGIEPIPKLNFSTTHDVWMGEYARMPDTDLYRKKVRELIAEVCELFGHPAYFHLGMDDEYYQAQKDYAYICVRGRVGFWRDALAMFEACRENGARPIFSGEYFYREPVLFKQNLPEDVIIEAPYAGLVEPSMNIYGRDGRNANQLKFEALAALPQEKIYAASGLTMFYLKSLADYARFAPQNKCIGILSASGEACTDRVDLVLQNDAYRLGEARRLYESDEKYFL